MRLPTVVERFKLARSANLPALDPLAGQNAFFFDRSYRGRELTILHGALALLGRIAVNILLTTVKIGLIPAQPGRSFPRDGR